MTQHLTWMLENVSFNNHHHQHNIYEKGGKTKVMRKMLLLLIDSLNDSQTYFDSFPSLATFAFTNNLPWQEKHSFANFFSSLSCRPTRPEWNAEWCKEPQHRIIIQKVYALTCWKRAQQLVAAVWHWFSMKIASWIQFA